MLFPRYPISHLILIDPSEIGEYAKIASNVSEVINYFRWDIIFDESLFTLMNSERQLPRKIRTHPVQLRADLCSFLKSYHERIVSDILNLSNVKLPDDVFITVNCFLKSLLCTN